MPRCLTPVPTDEDILDAAYIHVEHLLRFLETRAQDHTAAAWRFRDSKRSRSAEQRDAQAVEAREIARLLRDGQVRL